MLASGSGLSFQRDMDSLVSARLRESGKVLPSDGGRAETTVTRYLVTPPRQPVCPGPKVTAVKGWSHFPWVGDKLATGLATPHINTWNSTRLAAMAGCSRSPALQGLGSPVSESGFQSKERLPSLPLKASPC